MPGNSSHGLMVALSTSPCEHMFYLLYFPYLDATPPCHDLTGHSSSPPSAPPTPVLMPSCAAAANAFSFTQA